MTVPSSAISMSRVNATRRGSGTLRQLPVFTSSACSVGLVAGDPDDVAPLVDVERIGRVAALGTTGRSKRVNVPVLGS